MGFINDLYDRIGSNTLSPTTRIKVEGLPEVPPGYEWLIYQDHLGFHVELYHPDPMTCSYGIVENQDQVHEMASQIVSELFEAKED